MTCWILESAPFVIKPRLHMNPYERYNFHIQKPDSYVLLNFCVLTIINQKHTIPEGHNFTILCSKVMHPYIWLPCISEMVRVQGQNTLYFILSFRSLNITYYGGHTFMPQANSEGTKLDAAQARRRSTGSKRGLTEGTFSPNTYPRSLNYQILKKPELSEPHIGKQKPAATWLCVLTCCSPSP